MAILILALIGWISPASPTQAASFSLAWQLTGDGGWAEHPILKNGIAYVPWTDGNLMAIRLTTGEKIHSLPGVNDATAPFIKGNFIYSYDEAKLTEIDLATFNVVRTIPVTNGGYTENVPFDQETGYFFVRQVLTGEYKGRVSAIRLSDGGVAWSYPPAYEGGFDNQQNIILIGDSVFFQSGNSYWAGLAHFYRINKKTGQMIWSVELGPSCRGGYNNPIYDADHDVIYASMSWNDQSSRVVAIRRSTGQVLWKKDIAGGAIESTLTYYDNTLYLPLHNFSGKDGSYMAISALDGSTIWHEPGFFGEDGWSATGVDKDYLYRIGHGAPYIIVQNRKTGELVWSMQIDASAPCFNPILSNGYVLLGSETSVYALDVGSGLPVDSAFHGLNATGFNPLAVIRNMDQRFFLPLISR